MPPRATVAERVADGRDVAAVRLGHTGIRDGPAPGGRRTVADPDGTLHQARRVWTTAVVSHMVPLGQVQRWA